mgnify:CR=1 FL=1
MWVISEKEDKYVTTTWGSAIRLVAGEPKEVGHDIGLVCLQEGCTQIMETPTKTPETKEVKEVETVETKTTPDFENMTKGQIETYGRTMGIELDKRKKKTVLIEELKAAQ